MSELAQQMTGAAPAQQQRGTTVADLIERQKGEIARALPNAMSPERFARLVLTEVRKTPRLAECTPASLLGAVMTAAQLGLEPGHLQHAYLVPRRNHDVWEVQFQLGYRGMVDLALRSGRTLRVDARVVREHDEFEYQYGTTAFLRHRPVMADRGAPVWVYAVAELRDGGTPFVVLDIAEVERRRARGGKDGKNDSPAWRNDWDAMAAKTALRALAPWLPQTPEFAAAQRLDDQVRTDYSAPLDDLEVDDEPPIQVESEVVVEVVDAAGEDRRVLMAESTRTKRQSAAVVKWCAAKGYDLGVYGSWPEEQWAEFVAWVNEPEVQE
jgi:recombination protein RecT